MQKIELFRMETSGKARNMTQEEEVSRLEAQSGRMQKGKTEEMALEVFKQLLSMALLFPAINTISI